MSLPHPSPPPPTLPPIFKVDDFLDMIIPSPPPSPPPAPALGLPTRAMVVWSPDHAVLWLSVPMLLVLLANSMRLAHKQREQLDTVTDLTVSLECGSGSSRPTISFESFAAEEDLRGEEGTAVCSTCDDDAATEVTRLTHKTMLTSVVGV